MPDGARPRARTFVLGQRPQLTLRGRSVSRRPPRGLTRRSGTDVSRRSIGGAPVSIWMSLHPRAEIRTPGSLACSAPGETRVVQGTILNGADAIIRSHAIRNVPPDGPTSVNHQVS